MIEPAFAHCLSYRLMAEGRHENLSGGSIQRTERFTAGASLRVLAMPRARWRPEQVARQLAGRAASER